MTARKNFWTKLRLQSLSGRPIFVLAPMANVTDSVFRTIIAKYGKPDVMWTEFVSADGLVSAGRKRLLIDLRFSPKERPIVAQLFTGHPDAMRKAAKLVAKLGFDGLDINMGCPDRAVEKQGGGAAMIKNPEMALAVLRAAREGVGVNKKSGKESGASGIPVSVKTRIGYNKVDLGWIRLLLHEGLVGRSGSQKGNVLPALTIHLRTRKEMSDVPAHWEIMPEIVKLRDEVQKDLAPKDRTLIIGNGDVESVADGLEKTKESGCDGVMIGRGIFGKPWLFGSIKNIKSQFVALDLQEGVSVPGTPNVRLKILLEHAKLFDETFHSSNSVKSRVKPVKNFAVMKKHFKAYVSGWGGAKELRVKLMETNNINEVYKVIKEYMISYRRSIDSMLK